MKNQDAVYRRLRKDLDRLPVAFPSTRTGTDLRLLKHLFSPEEAEIALALNAVPEPVEKIHRRLRRKSGTPDELRLILDRMCQKGAILGGMAMSKGKRVLGYSKAPLVVGMFEMQVNRLTRGFVDAFHAYKDETQPNPFFSKKTSQMRTVPINVEVGEPGTVGLYDDVRGYIHRTRGPFAVMNCVCRQAQGTLGRSCASGNHETCLTLGSSAVYMQRMGHARLISRDEILAVLDSAQERGLVLQPQNTQAPEFICCCCKDCCEVLAGARKLPRPSEYFRTNFQARVDQSLCKGCKTCVKRCPMDAVSVAGKVASVDEGRCIGCGLCASTCENEAIRLRPLGEQSVPPRDRQMMYQKIMLDRFGPLRAIAKTARVVLGMKL